MTTISNTISTSGVRYLQTSISSYFKGCSSGRPTPFCETVIKCKPKRPKKKIRRVPAIDTPNIKPEVGMALSNGSQKRKLCVQIFSEDEDDDENNSVTKISQETTVRDSMGPSPNKKAMTQISLNKPKVQDYSPEKHQVIQWKPMPVIPFLRELDATGEINSACGTPLLSSTQLLTSGQDSFGSAKSPKEIQSFHSVSTVVYCASTSSTSTAGPSKSEYYFNKSVASRKTYLESSSDSEQASQNEEVKTIIKTPSRRARRRPKRIHKDFVDRAVGNLNSISNGINRSPTVCSKKLFVESEKSVNETIKTKQVPNSSPKKVKILDNVVLSTPVAKPLKKPMGRPKRVTEENLAKDETKKKPNYHNLTIFQSFWEKTQTKKHLKFLLSKDDRDKLEIFFNMNKDHQYTCIKLFTWKCIWYNVFSYVDKINLRLTDSEVMDLYHVLQRNRFVDTDYMSESAVILLNLLELNQLKDIYKKLKISGQLPTKKDGYIAKLLTTCNTQSTLTHLKTMEQILKDRVHEKLGFCIKLSTTLQDCLFRLYLLNTFANPVFVKPDVYFNSVGFLNVVFPTYQVDDFLVFYNEVEFSRYCDAVKCCNELEKVIENKNIESAVALCKLVFFTLQQLVEQGQKESSRQPHLQHLTAISKYIRCLSMGCKYLLTTQQMYVKNWLEYLLSLNYSLHKHGHWYVQLALIQTTYLKEYELAAKTVINALEKKREIFSEVQLHELANRGRLLNKKTYKVAPLFHDQIAALLPPSCDRDWPSITIDRRAMNNDRGGKLKYIQIDANGVRTYMGVEQAAMQHYLSNGYSNAEHYEGSAVCALFCLFFWDIIYDTYVPGAFVSDVQTFPLDMYSAFYSNRETVIRKRLKEIRDDWPMEQLTKVLIENWNAHSHEESLCHIDKVFQTPELLQGIVKCVGRQVLARIFERLVINFREYRSGFPDLLIWDVATEKSKFVEVKGENDKLSIKQKLWLNYLSDIGANIELCHVHSIGFRKKVKQPKKQDPSGVAT